jgi:hypothetical protein
MAKNGLKWLKIAMQPRLRTVFSWEIISTRAQKEKFPGFVIFFSIFFFKNYFAHFFFSQKRRKNRTKNGEIFTKND